jgi:glycosyltransferase involved in cell wall biosynthesis
VVLGVDGRVLDDRYHGIGRTTFELVKRLAGSGEFEVVLFTSATQRTERFDLTALTSLAPVRQASFDPPLTSVLQFARWPLALRREGIQVALFPYHLGASLLGGGRRWSIVHDCILEADPRFAPDRRTRMLYMALTAVVLRRTAVITPSVASARAVERTYRARVPDDHVVGWGVDPAFGRAARRPDRVGGVTIPERYLLHVGARRPHKNVANLVRVLARLTADDHLVLVGSADPRWPDDVLEVARSLGVSDRVVQVSGVSESDLLGLYAGARAFVYPSLVEGFGLPLLEAFAAGLPVVASDIPVFQEVARGAALLRSPDDVPGWVQALAELDNAANRSRLVDAGFERAGQATWERSSNQLSRLLRG